MHAINVRSLKYYAGRSCAGWRKSPLGNPHGGPDREQNIALFKRDLWAAMQAGLSGSPMTTWHQGAWNALLDLVARTKAGEDVAVGLLVKPQSCHTDVICAAVAWLCKQNVPPARAAGREEAKKKIGSSRRYCARHEPISEVEFCTHGCQ